MSHYMAYHTHEGSGESGYANSSLHKSNLSSSLPIPASSLCHTEGFLLLSSNYRHSIYSIPIIQCEKLPLKKCPLRPQSRDNEGLTSLSSHQDVAFSHFLDQSEPQYKRSVWIQYSTFCCDAYCFLNTWRGFWQSWNNLHLYNLYMIFM